MKTLQQIIPLAMEAITESGIAHGNSVRREFNGYISSLGASIITSGLLPTILFFGEKGGAQAERPQIIKAIQFMLQKNKIIQKDLLEEVKNCLNENNHVKLERITDEVMNSATALKLVIRTYNLTD